jgi:excisionase family DNA binding protein
MNPEENITSNIWGETLQDSEKYNIPLSAQTGRIDVNNEKNFIFKETTGHDKQLFSIKLISEKADTVRAINSIKNLLDKKVYGVKVDIEQFEKGKVFFNFLFRPMPRIRMLDSKSVYKMLQISQSFLNKLIQTKQIKSYKIGRLRRFSLEDILNYISKNREIL